jgi:hypothetical protein
MQAAQGFSKYNISMNWTAAINNAYSFSLDGIVKVYLSAAVQHSVKQPLCTFVNCSILLSPESSTSNSRVLQLPQKATEQHEWQFRIHLEILLNSLLESASLP